MSHFTGKRIGYFIQIMLIDTGILIGLIYRSISFIHKKCDLMEQQTNIKGYTAKIMRLNLLRMLIYEKAFRRVLSSSFKKQAEQYVYMSNHNIERIQTVMGYYGVELRLTDSVYFFLYRNWLYLKMLCNKNNDRSIIKCCLQAELSLAAAYRRVMDIEAFGYPHMLLHHVLQKQYGENYHIIRSLKSVLQPIKGIPSIKFEAKQRLSRKFTAN